MTANSALWSIELRWWPSFRAAGASMLAFSLVTVSHAAPAPASSSAPAPPPAAAQACAACHGAQGEGDSATGSPRIAGQSQYYLANQLESYVDGRRRSAVMEPIARSLPPETRAALASYYARIDAPVAKRSGRAPTNERGLVLAITGDHVRRVQACGNCHGPGGIGEPPAAPYLAGLDAGYLSSTLNAWKDGTRRTDAGQQMAVVARAMAAEDITAVTQYYASLPPPKPWPLSVVQAPARRTAPASGTTPTVGQATGAAPAAGIDQGAPTGGGTLGEGGVGSPESAPTHGARSAAPAVDASKIQAPVSNKASNQSGPVVSDASTSPLPMPVVGPAGGGDPARGRVLVASGAYGCAACHAIPDIRSPRGIVGPPLSGMASRAFIAGQLPNRPDILVAFLQDPPALVANTGMPNVGLSAQQAQDIAAYLSTLEP